MNNKAIAKQLVEDFEEGAFVFLPNDRVEFSIDGLTIRCANSYRAVGAVAQKFTKGLRHGGKSVAWPVRSRA